MNVSGQHPETQARFNSLKLAEVESQCKTAEVPMVTMGSMGLKHGDNQTIHHPPLLGLCRFVMFGPENVG